MAVHVVLQILVRAQHHILVQSVQLVRLYTVSTMSIYFLFLYSGLLANMSKRWHMHCSKHLHLYIIHILVQPVQLVRYYYRYNCILTCLFYNSCLFFDCVRMVEHAPVLGYTCTCHINIYGCNLLLNS